MTLLFFYMEGLWLDEKNSTRTPAIGNYRSLVFIPDFSNPVVYTYQFVIHNINLFLAVKRYRFALQP